MQKLIMMCGCPGSGKSTWAQKYYNKYNATTKLVSRDGIRFSLIKEDEPYFSKEKQVFRKFVNNIKDGLVEGYNVIADATHLNMRSRFKLLNSLDGYLNDVEVVLVIMRRPLEQCLTWNKNRESTRAFVPETVIRNMYNSFEMPEDVERIDSVVVYG